MKYTFTHGEGNDCIPGTITKDFTDEIEAVEFISKLIRDGLRNKAWATMNLRDGWHWSGRNIDGWCEFCITRP